MRERKRGRKRKGEKGEKENGEGKRRNRRKINDRKGKRKGEWRRKGEKGKEGKWIEREKERRPLPPISDQNRADALDLQCRQLTSDQNRVKHISGTRKRGYTYKFTASFSAQAECHYDERSRMTRFARIKFIISPTHCTLKPSLSAGL